MLVDIFLLVGTYMYLDHFLDITIITFKMVIGLDIMTQCFWEGHIGILLLSPHQIVLGDIIDHVHTGDPRTMVDLIHLHGFTLMIHKAGSSHS